MLTVLLASTELQNAPKLHPVLPAEGRPSTAPNAMLGVLLPALLGAPKSHMLQGWCGAPKALGSGSVRASSPPHSPFVLHQSLLCFLWIVLSVCWLWAQEAAGSLHPPASVG